VQVCARDVKCCNISGRLLIARGDVQIRGCAYNCRIITAGSVQFLPSEVLPPYIRRRKVEIREHEPNPLGFVQWFDPARVGVTVEAAAGGVRVRAAAKSFAAAGLRAGDLLSAIDGEAVKSPDEFRLLLRARLADGGKMALAVRRAGRDLTIPVRCKD
jgi:S1-C subfamily serine protease